METTETTFGPHLYGAMLLINEPIAWGRDRNPSIVIDVETDEKDNFVGIALCNSQEFVAYYTNLDDCLFLLESSPLVGHNLKGDIKWLKGWGVDIKPEQLWYDTCLASYVQNTTKETHSLKDLAKESLGMEWPTYKEMVGTGRNKTTLDKQSTERVARYCGMDCLATYKLYQYFEEKLTPQQKKYLQEIELPTARVLLEMELKGVRVDTNYLRELDEKYEFELGEIEKQLEGMWLGKEFLNVNSNRQIAELLEHQGASLPKTAKGNKKVDKATLEQWSHLPAVPLLLEYSKIEKLRSTYTQALLEKQKDGKIYCSFNQLTRDSKGKSVGISTGRLSSSNPNLQNIPARTDEGKDIRRAFVPSVGKVFIDADFGQIEPRLVAHFSKDQLFIKAYRDGRDLYQELVDGTGRSRQDGKTFMLALLYGAQARKLASVFKCSEKEAEKIIEDIMKKLPGVRAWIERTKYEARQKGGVSTLFGRWIPLPGLKSTDRYEKLHWERVAVNTVIQGTGAEALKKSLTVLKEAGYVPNLTVHDSFLIEVDETSVEKEVMNIKSVLERVLTVDVPLLVECKVGKSWGDAEKWKKK